MSRERKKENLDWETVALAVSTSITAFFIFFSIPAILMGDLIDISVILLVFFTIIDLYLYLRLKSK